MNQNYEKKDIAVDLTITANEQKYSVSLMQLVEFLEAGKQRKIFQSKEDLTNMLEVMMTHLLDSNEEYKELKDCLKLLMELRLMFEHLLDEI